MQPIQSNVIKCFGTHPSEKQERLEKIREKLHAQMQQMRDDEDDRIARAVKESEEKRAKEEATKEAWNRKMHNEIAQHRHQQVRHATVYSWAEILPTKHERVKG